MTSPITAQVACEIVSHEAIVCEWYKDSEGIGTWAIGITDASGHKVARYKDNPQSISKCLEVYLWLLETKYLPDVLRAFGSRKLAEHELAAALSFHYNTGAILRTDWVKLVLAGKRSEARTFLQTHYLNGDDLKKRRLQEAALFFDGKWSNDGTTTVWQVKKPAYTPDWSRGRKIEIRSILQSMLGGR